MSEHDAIQEALGNARPGEAVYLPPTVKTTQNSYAATGATKDSNRLAAEEYFSSGDALHGDRVPSMRIDKETPSHRLMIWMHAQGASNKDIGAQLGYTPFYVGQVLRQPWARLRLTDILREAGIDKVKHFLANEVAPSLEVLRDIRDNGTNRASDRASAANSILDRALGKPVAKVESDSTVRNLPADVVRLEADIAAARKQLEDMGHGNGNSSPVGSNN